MRASIFFYIFCLGLLSCNKSGGSTPALLSPTNLNVSAVVSTDNSGNVSFTATASNAATFEFDYGNGVFENVPSGIVQHKYNTSGNYTVKVTAKGSAGTTAISKNIDITVSVGLALVWSDEFDVPGAPNASKWGYDIGTGAGGWGNNELQYYTNRTDNAYVSNGTLKIVAKKEAYQGSQYTSARLLTKGKFSFKYGKVEARAKLPAGVGTWPAIWMLGDNINTVQWPACGEIDIMEHVGKSLNTIYGTLHYPGRSGGNADGKTTVINNVTTEFHKYGMEWNASYIKFYVDDVLFFTYTNSASTPFNQNFFLILNSALGGNFGGPIDPNYTSAEFEIDYIRVYQ